MTVAGGLEGADPTDLAGLREALTLAAIEASTGGHAEAIVGKPSLHMVATLLTGDRFATDTRMANEAGMASTLVLTGATGLDEASAPRTGRTT
jgi:arabinose operon protein AraL